MDLSIISKETVESEFVQQSASKPLRVCCYGSSSSSTPEKYLIEARSLGYILAKRGHTCVNGAGSYGCMAAMNDGAYVGDGHIVGVIHEMWLQQSSNLRDGGAHTVFSSTENAAGNTVVENKHGGPHPVFQGPKREMLVAGGKDLQERKRLLVDKADALIVLPGGPGTWDELWEMACAKGIGLTNIPIVCINCDNYYEPFRQMLQRAYDDQLAKLVPDDIVHFENTAEGAVKWIEDIKDGRSTTPTHTNTNNNTRTSAALRKGSVLHTPVLNHSDSWIRRSFRKSISNVSGLVEESPPWIRMVTTFTAGMAVGAAIVSLRISSRR